jgi:hypothetical protein
MADAVKKKFLIGVLLAWVPWIPIVIGLRAMFRGMSGSKAVGVSALAVSLGEGFALWGIVAMVIAQVAAIVWLGKSVFARKLVARSDFCGFDRSERTDAGFGLHIRCFDLVLVPPPGMISPISPTKADSSRSE